MYPLGKWGFAPSVKDDDELLIVDTGGLPKSREISKLTFNCLQGFGHSQQFLTLLIMLKCLVTAQKVTCKRRKGGTRYPVTKFDLPQDNKTVEENICVLDILTSGRMGCISMGT